MSDSSLIPEGENLRRAIFWIGSQSLPIAKCIELASLQYDLTPLETEFLFRHFQVSPTAADKSDRNV